MRVDQRRGEQAQEQRDRGVRLRHLEPQLLRVLAQETRQIRRRGVGRIQLNHRGGDEQEAHGGQRSADGVAMAITQPEQVLHRAPANCTQSRPTSVTCARKHCTFDAQKTIVWWQAHRQGR